MSATHFSGPVVSDTTFNGTMAPKLYTTATLPTASASNQGQLNFITDNGVSNNEFALVVSDGTNWVKVTTTALT